MNIFFLAAMITGVAAMTSCSKSNNNSSAPAKDSVLYSGWITLNMAATNNGDTVFTQTIQAPSITSAILNKGSVVGYILTTDAINGTDSSIVDAVADLNLFQTFSVGKIELVDFFENLTGNSYRYVVIPGSITVTDVSGAVHTYTASDLAKMSYRQVSQILHLPSKGSSALLSGK